MSPKTLSSTTFTLYNKAEEHDNKKEHTLLVAYAMILQSKERNNQLNDDVIGTSYCVVFIIALFECRKVKPSQGRLNKSEQKKIDYETEQ